MSPQEHYFENILYNYKRTGKLQLEDEANTHWMTWEEIQAVQKCAIYVLDNICKWDQKNVEHILELDYN